MFPRSRARQVPPTTPIPTGLPTTPLMRGYIDTGDLQMNAAPGETRVDLRQRTPEVLHSLRKTTDPAGFPYGRKPALPAPARTVYVTLNRPDGERHHHWRRLVAAVRMVWTPSWVVQELATATDAEFPCVTWILLIPAEVVVPIQARVLEAIEGFGPVVEVIWAEATPRTLRHLPGV